MSKNISIAEGGVARQFTNDKLKINLVGGGTEYYVLESGVQLTTKSVTANGTYKASDEGKYGFSQFSVNVRGAAGSADSHGKPTGGDIKPGGAGSAVVGTDPETGNDVVVGVDEDDNLVKTPLPSSIVLVTNPTKMSYQDGESIDLTGAVVVAKNGDGTTWTSADYPNGHIPLGEIVIEPTAASGGLASVSVAALNITSAAVVDGNIIATMTCWNAYTEYASFEVPPGMKTISFTAQGSATDHSVHMYDVNPGVVCTLDDSPTYHGHTPGETLITQAGTYSISGSGKYLTFSFGFVKDNTPLTFNAVNIKSTNTVIKLKWSRPADGLVLSTTFEINVPSASASGSHTTESSSGQEGSGGGGSF